VRPEEQEFEMDRTTKARAAVLVAGGLALVLKVLVSFRTFGTGDIGRWQLFADGVRSAGPVGVYGLTWPGSLYNHPPVIGYFLEFVNGVRHLGPGVGTTIRITASAADVVSAVLVFELLRRRGSLRTAATSGVLVAVSPVLFTVSGFHGNTDTIFTMLTLLSLWLLADRDNPLLAGATMALALGVKIVPIVVVPALLVYAALRGRGTFWQFAGAGVAVFVVTWGPALALQGGNVLAHVIFYKGSDLRQWGLVQIGHWFGDPFWVSFLAGPGRFVVLVLCCAVPAAFVWRRPELLSTAVGLSLAAFLLLSPAFGVQYAAWPVAGAYLVALVPATLYNAAAGVMLFAIYNRWSGGLPWNRADASGFTDSEVAIGLVAWCMLLFVVVAAGWKMATAVRRPPPARPTGAAERRGIPRALSRPANGRNRTQPMA
jgi:hypothetical protein